MAAYVLCRETHLVEVLPSGWGDRGTDAELIGIRLARHLYNGQPGAFHCVTCSQKSVLSMQKADMERQKLTRYLCSMRRQWVLPPSNLCLCIQSLSSNLQSCNTLFQIVRQMFTR